MGDDRRGGHTWKYVSQDTVRRRHSQTNSKLLEDGTLYVARYHPDGTGQWIPLTLSTPTNPLRPSEISSVPVANGFTSGTLFNGRIRLPRRDGVAGQTIDWRLVRLRAQHRGGRASRIFPAGTSTPRWPTSIRPRARSCATPSTPATWSAARQRRARKISRSTRATRARCSSRSPTARPGGRLSGLAHLRSRQADQCGERHPAVRRSVQDHGGPA